MPTEELFQKQRKITVAFSTFVILFNMAGSKLSKINFLGNEIILNNPNSIKVILLIAMTYFFIRYLQFMHGVKDKGISDAFYKRAKEHIQPHLLNRIFKRAENDLLKEFGSRKEVVIDRYNVFNPSVKPGTASISFYNKRGGTVHEFRNEKILKEELIIAFIRSSLYVIFRTHFFTEYAFPIIYICIAYASYLPSFIKFFGISF